MTFGALLFAGFWDKRLGILGAAGSVVTFIMTVTIIPLGGVRRRFSGDDRQYSVPHEGRRALGRLDLPAEAGHRSYRSAMIRPYRQPPASESFAGGVTPSVL